MRDSSGQLRVDSGVKIASVLYCSQRSDILSFLFWCLRIIDQLSIEGVKVLLINNDFPSSLVFELEGKIYIYIIYNYIYIYIYTKVP